jgi:hypothetical protein
MNHFTGFDKSAEEIRNAVQELSKQMQSNETELLQKAEQQLEYEVLCDVRISFNYVLVN